MKKKIPEYMRVYFNIKEQIIKGEYQPNDIMPPEYELEKQFHVSRITVRKAISMLSEEGYLYVKQGKGTIVLDCKTQQKLNYVTSFSETLREKGYRVSSKSIHVERIIPSQSVLEKLSLENDSTVIRIQRTQYANDKSIAIMENYLSPAFFPGFEEKSGSITSLYSFIEKNYNITIESATEYITAVAADFFDSEILDVPVGTPLLLVRRLSFTSGRPIEYAVLKIVAEKYEYCINLKDRPPEK